MLVKSVFSNFSGWEAQLSVVIVNIAASFPGLYYEIHYEPVSKQSTLVIQPNVDQTHTQDKYMTY